MKKNLPAPFLKKRKNYCTPHHRIYSGPIYSDMRHIPNLIHDTYTRYETNKCDYYPWKYDIENFL